MKVVPKDDIYHSERYVLGIDEIGKKVILLHKNIVYEGTEAATIYDPRTFQPLPKKVLVQVPTDKRNSGFEIMLFKLEHFYSLDDYREIQLKRILE